MAKGVCCLTAAPGVETCKGSSPLLKGGPACTSAWVELIIDSAALQSLMKHCLHFIIVLSCKMPLGGGICVMTFPPAEGLGSMHMSQMKLCSIAGTASKRRRLVLNVRMC